MKKWQGFIDAFYAMISAGERAMYQPIIDALVGLGYVPLRKRTKGFILSFSHPAHNRVLARFGVREGGERAFFGLRFSSCTGYSDKFAHVIRDRLLSRGSRPAKCAACGYCKGDKWVYTYTFPDGQTKAACGAFVLEIPDVTPGDLDEINALIHQQHAYFMRYALYTAPPGGTVFK